jgi:SAM-dependent methyltransferase
VGWAGIKVLQGRGARDQMLASPTMLAAESACPICGSETAELAAIRSDFSHVEFLFRRCEGCGLVFVSNPSEDFASLYDAAYYRGDGADSFVNYTEEMSNPDTIRAYEWRGITRAVQSLSEGQTIRWLDFGCGLGGLVRYARGHGFPNVYGYDHGWGADWARNHGIELLDDEQLREQAGSFDVVTAIEVVEHIPGPLGTMRQIASLLKPGGVFFLTTGNAAPHRDSFATWKYVHPDIHVAYFEPRTLSEAYRRVGLTPVAAGFLPGHEDIIRYKVLRTLHGTSRNPLERLVPWRFASRLIDRRYQLSEQPLARKPAR